ncbi:MAG: exonuclease domain-containing protein [Pseudomonadota bacterium]
MWTRWSLRFRIFLFFALIVLGGAAGIAGGIALGYGRLGSADPLSAFVLAGAVAAFALGGIVLWVWLLFDENVAKPVQRLSSDLRARTHTDVDTAIEAGQAQYLGDLGPAASAVAESLVEKRSALAEAVARETQAIAEQNARLALVLRDVPDGIVLCTAQHRIALYNEQAADILGRSPKLGLDRSLFDLLAGEPIRHAFDRLAVSRDPGAPIDVLCTTADGEQLISGKMRRMPDSSGQGPPGYMLTLHDITRTSRAGASRQRALTDHLVAVRRPTANIATTLGALRGHAQLTPDQKNRLQTAMGEEIEDLARAVSRLTQAHDAMTQEWWPMCEIAVADLANALMARADLRVGTLPEPMLLVRCDSFSIVRLLSAGAALLSAAGGTDPRLDARADELGILLTLSTDGGELPVSKLEAWLGRDLDDTGPGTTPQEILARHSTECWRETGEDGRLQLCVALREARALEPPQQVAPRVEFYDFGLLDSGDGAAPDDRPLSDVSYVVFDTETTGLLPHQGDELVQIAAVRIVNQRLLTGERFDMLVNPGRIIPELATSVHGITNEMVIGAPNVAEAVAQFHGFCGDAVLIAHNAPFDMAFLRRAEPEIDARFQNTVLDTVLLSAVLYGRTEEHSLDALTHRLGIEIPPEHRHTAIGDALATAEAFLRLVPLLNEQGFVTIGETLAEFRKHRSLLKSVS